MAPSEKTFGYVIYWQCHMLATGERAAYGLLSTNIEYPICGHTPLKQQSPLGQYVGDVSRWVKHR